MDKNYLLESYINKRKSVRNIAVELNVTANAVMHWLKKYNIKRRTRSELVTVDNNLAVMNPTLIKEWDYQKNTCSPEYYMPNSKVKVYWICHLGHSWEAAIFSRNRGNNCPVCSGRKASIATNLITMTLPELIKEWDYERNHQGPECYTLGSSQKVYWKCQKCNFRWYAVICTRTKGIGCPCCAGQIVTPTHNLAVCFPELLVEWDYVKNNKLPTEYLPKVRKSVWWKCLQCEHTWQADIVARSRGFKKCPSCYKPKYGFNQNKPAYFYVQNIRIQGLELIKFGITNRDPRIRMFEMQKNSEGMHKLHATQYFE